VPPERDLGNLDVDQDHRDGRRVLRVCGKGSKVVRVHVSPRLTPRQTSAMAG
jgi:hypothetical protein